MVLKTFTYYENGKKEKIDVRVCNSIWSQFRGLMFRKTSPPLLFILSKEKKFFIHSFFCKPFTAIWIDADKKVTRNVPVNNWKLRLAGRGKYLLEIPTRITR